MITFFLAYILTQGRRWWKTFVVAYILTQDGNGWTTFVGVLYPERRVRKGTMRMMTTM